MCATLTWPENPGDAISEVLNSKIFLGVHAPRPPKRACFRTLRHTVYVALPVPEQLPYSGYATGAKVSFTEYSTSEMHSDWMPTAPCKVMNELYHSKKRDVVVTRGLLF